MSTEQAQYRTHSSTYKSAYTVGV